MDDNKNSKTSEVKKSLRWIDAIHIAGSVASLTGISLLAITKTIQSISIGSIIGWVLGSSIILAALMACLLFISKSGVEVREKFGVQASIIFYLISTSILAVGIIFLFKMIQELGVPFVILLIHNQYPVP